MIRLDNRIDRNDIIKNAKKKLKNNPIYKDKVFINPDLTAAERDYEFKLRSELRKLKSNSADGFTWGRLGNRLHKFKINKKE